MFSLLFSSGSFLPRETDLPILARDDREIGSPDQHAGLFVIFADYLAGVVGLRDRDRSAACLRHRGPHFGDRIFIQYIALIQLAWSQAAAGMGPGSSAAQEIVAANRRINGARPMMIDFMVAFSIS